MYQLLCEMEWWAWYDTRRSSKCCVAKVKWDTLASVNVSDNSIWFSFITSKKYKHNCSFSKFPVFKQREIQLQNKSWHLLTSVNMQPHCGGQTFSVWSFFLLRYFTSGGKHIEYLEFEIYRVKDSNTAQLSHTAHDTSAPVCLLVWGDSFIVHLDTLTPSLASS